VHSAATLADPVTELCPGCGKPLESVGDLAEIVGFRAIGVEVSPEEEGASADRLTNQVGDLAARRDEILARSWLDTGPWIDEHGSLRAQAVALPPPTSNP
jgi:hypothetical protein